MCVLCGDEKRRKKGKGKRKKEEKKGGEEEWREVYGVYVFVVCVIGGVCMRVIVCVYCVHVCD